MKTLTETLLAAHHRDEFLDDVVALIETHVARLPGLKGLSFKAGLVAANRAVPDVIQRGTRRLMPQFLDAIEPLHQEFRTSGTGDFSVFFGRNADRAAELLLSVSDARLAQSQNATAQSFYKTFRGYVSRELSSAMPAFGKLIRNYLD